MATSLQQWRGPKEIELKLVTDQIERERNPKRNIERAIKEIKLIVKFGMDRS
jgi:hypothetical protein